MAMRLYWKSWEITNIVFNSLLRYPFHVFMLPQEKKMVLVNPKVTEVPLFLSLLTLLAVFISYFVLIMKSLVFKTLSIEPHLVLLNIAISGMVFLCLLLVTILISYSQTFAQYNNALLRYYTQIVEPIKSKASDSKVFSTWFLFQNGKYFIQNSMVKFLFI